MNFTCLIVDDEPVAHSILQNYIADIPTLRIAGSFFNAVDARKFLDKQQVDLLFLDIQMPEINGLDLLKQLPAKPVTILITALLTHAIEAYDLDVIDYLVKPIRPERFLQAVEKATEFLRMQKQAGTLATGNPVEKKQITIKSGIEKIIIDTATISHIQSLKDYMLIYTPERKHIVRATTAKILAMLPGNQFIRVHKSFIVNRSRIKRIASNKIEIDGFTIPLGKLFKNALL